MVIIVIQNVIQYIKRPGICIKIIRGIWIAIPFFSFFFGQEWVNRAMADPLCSNAKLKWRFIFRKIPSHLTFPIYRLWQARARGVPYFSVSCPKKKKKLEPLSPLLDLEWICYKYKLSRPLLWHTLSGEIHPWKCKISPAEFSFSGIAHFLC